MARLKWRCEHGHAWRALLVSVRSGSWCPTCARATSGDKHRRWNIEKVKALAESKGGTLVSTSYTNNKELLEWRCAREHTWRASLANVKGKTWCPTCARDDRRLGIEQAHAVAQKNGGRCLSTIYRNSSSPLEFECARGHRWRASLSTVKGDHWCRRCGNSSSSMKKRAKRLEQALSVARSHSGSLLRLGRSTTAPSAWQCSEGHEFKVSLHNARKGSWCRDCHGWQGEAICRGCFETMFGMPFPTSRPAWLRNPSSGLPLQLDGYSARLQVAFEFQGQHHFRSFDGRFHGHNDSKLSDLRRRDRVKSRLCRTRGVLLIRVPATVDLQSIPERARIAVKRALRRAGRPIPKAVMITPLTLVRPMNSSPMARLRAHVAAKGGTVVGPQTWFGTHGRYEFQCGEGHRWRTKAMHILGNRSWCPMCSGNARRTIEDLRAEASKRGGVLLSKRYRNNKTKLRWRCGRGHEFKQSGNQVLRGRWCVICGREDSAAKRRASTDEVAAAAAKLGCTWLGGEYVNSTTRTWYRCGVGHRFQTNHASIRDGHGCPRCGRVLAGLKIRDAWRRATPAARKARRAAARAAAKRPEVFARRSKAQLATWRDPRVRGRRVRGMRVAMARLATKRNRARVVPDEGAQSKQAFARG